MQNLINANQGSATQTLYNDIGTVIPFYKESPAYGPLGIQFHNQGPAVPVSGPIANRSTVINFPSGAGFMYNMSVACLCTGLIAAGDLAAGVFPGFNVIRSFQFESGGKILLNKTKNALFCQFKQEQNETFKNFSFTHARALNPVTEDDAQVGDTSFLFYIPFAESFLSRPEKLLLLDALKDLKLRIFFDTQEASGLTNPISAIECAIIAQSYAPKMTIFTEMKVKDWSKDFVMEMMSTDEEVYPLTNATTMRLSINTTNLVSKTHLLVRKTNTAATTTVAHRYGLPIVKVRSVAFNLNGQTFLDGTIKPSRLNEAAARYGNTNLVVGTTAAPALSFVNDMITFDWGVLCGRNMNSGTAFLGELKGSTITITYDAFPGGGDDTHTDYAAFLEHECPIGVGYFKGSGNDTGTLLVTSQS